jgi:hypothetical protein
MMRFWQVYVWIFSVVLLFSAVGRVVLRFRKSHLVSRLDVVESFVGLLCIPALLGFAYRHPYGNRNVWQCLCVLVIGFSVYQFFGPKMKQLYEKSFLIAGLTITLQIAVGAPALWALLQYAFLERAIWLR